MKTSVEYKQRDYCRYYIRRIGKAIMVNQKLTRRQFVGGSLGASLLASVRTESEARDETASGSNYRLFWGDLHNHNAKTITGKQSGIPPQSDASTLPR